MCTEHNLRIAIGLLNDSLINVYDGFVSWVRLLLKFTFLPQRFTGLCIERAGWAGGGVGGFLLRATLVLLLSAVMNLEAGRSKELGGLRWES